MKGQELPTSTIILIILTVVILIFVIVYIILPIIKVGTPKSPSTSMASFTFNCATYCGQPASANNIPADTYFCKDTIDYNGTIYHCYDVFEGKQIATCSYTAQNGTRWSDIGSVECG